MQGVSVMEAHPLREPLPVAIEAEQALLGAFLLDNTIYWKVKGFLNADQFDGGERGVHGVIFGIIAQMLEENRPVTALTLLRYIKPDAMVNNVQLRQYIMRLQSEAIGTVTAGEHARAIVDAWALRQFIARSEDGIAAARRIAPDVTAERVITNHIAEVSTIRRQVTFAGEAVSMAEAVDEAVSAIDAAFQFQKPAGIVTGIDAVDQLIGPAEPGQQIVIGGGTKQGKTALALQAAVGIAQRGGTVWIYSGEMSIKQLAMREIARRTGIPVARQKEGRISQKDWQDLRQVQEEVRSLPILIEKRRLTLDRIHDIGRNIKAERGLAAMVIDHVGLLQWDKDNARRDEWDLSQKATQWLKAIYEDLGVPGFSLVQLKKNTFVGSGRGTFAQRLREAMMSRPKFTDLMGAVERDADHVLIPFNARPVIATLEPEQESDDYLIWEDKMREYRNRAEIILALSREQEFPARRTVEWHGETTSFGPAFKGHQESLL